MIPYIVTFTTAFLLAWVSERDRRIKNTKILSIFFLLLSAVVSSLLAALRHDSIGTDVHTYVIRLFEEAKNHESFIRYLLFHMFEYVEFGYMLFNFVISRFTEDLRVFHFCVALFGILFVLAYLWENRRKMSVSFGFFVFMMMIYNIGFNAVRQIMAVCVCLYSFNAARDRKLKKFIVLMVLAMFFHRSSIIMVISYPLVAVFNRKTIFETNRLIAIITIATIVSIFFINSIVSILIRIGLFSTKYSHYIGDGFSISRLSALIFFIPIFTVFKFYEKKFYEQDSFNAILFLYVLLWPIIAQLDSVSDQLGRMAYFFLIANIGLYAQLPMLQKNVKNKRNVRIIRVMSVLFLIFYWVLCFYIWKVGHTVPYIFS